MKSTSSDIAAKFSGVIDRCYFPFAILFLLALVYNHIQLIAYPLPLDYNEPAAQTITATIAALENPYSIENQPSRTSAYPVLYNMLVAPLTALFGNTLQLHRLVTGAFIIASCVLVFFVTLRVSQSARDSFAASILLYAGLLFYATPMASPSSVGLFLFLSSLFIPWYYGFSNRSLGVALALGLLAFFGKQYFLACLGYTALFLFLSVSKIRGAIFGLLSLASFAVSIAVADRVAPYFLDIAVFTGSSVKYVASNTIMLTQLRAYGLVSLPLLAILVMQSTVMFFSRRATAPSNSRPRGRFMGIDLLNLSAPLLSRAPDYFWICIACSLTIVVFVLSINPGNYLSYHFQLISPFLLILTFTSLSRAVKLKAISQLLVLVAFYASYSILSHDFTVRKLENWQRLEQTIDGKKKVYATPIILGKILEKGGEIYQNGHTVYFLFASDRPAWLDKKNPEETARRLWEKHIEKIYSMIEAQEFDVIVLDRYTEIPSPHPGTHEDRDGTELLQKYYRLRETIPVHLAHRRGGGMFQVQIWEPISKSASENTTAQ
jgi:hypothetical protein